MVLKSEKATKYYYQESRQNITVAHRCRFALGGKEVANCNTGVSLCH
jgi:hypothetical protein